MAKNNNATLIVLVHVISWLLPVFLVLGILVWGALTPVPLPERILHLPAPEQIGDFVRGREKIIYAKEPLLFEETGTYVVRGYLKASQPLGDSIAIYMRENDPASDPACKLLAVPLQTQSGAPGSSVYVCERRRDDAKISVAEFANTNLASFCSFELKGRKVVIKPLNRRPSERPDPSDIVATPKPWIGVEWSPSLPHPLTLVFKNLLSVKVFNLPFIAFRPCAPLSR